MAIFIIGLILIIIGLSALIGFSLLRLIIALVIIAIGVRLIMRPNKKNHWSWPESTISSENFIDDVLIFSPISKSFESENFRGGKVVMIFAGGQINLSQVKTSEKEINLELVAIFGGAKIIVPKNWRINSQGTAIFGGYDNRTEQGTSDTILNIKGSAIFGGIEIIN